MLSREMLGAVLYIPWFASIVGGNVKTHRRTSPMVTETETVLVRDRRLTNFRFSEGSRSALSEMASRMGLSQREFLERLIQAAHRLLSNA